MGKWQITTLYLIKNTELKWNYLPIAIDFGSIVASVWKKYTRSSQTAYQQTSEWQDTLHHYIGISFTYHLDAKKKDN